MKNNLYLIIDNSQSYLDNKVKEIVKTLHENVECQTVNYWVKGLSSSSSLFGEKIVTRLHLEDSSQLDNFNKLIKKNPNLFKDDWFGNGVIITTTLGRGTKAVETLIEKSNGLIIKKRKPEEVKSELLSSLKLQPIVLDFLSKYVGDDYDYLINICNTIGKRTPEEQQSMNIEELLIFLPSKPGEIPPWDYLNNVFEGNLKNALENSSRGLVNSSLILMIILLKNKLELLYKYTLLNLEKKSDKEKVVILGRKSPYEFISFNKMRNKPSLQTCEYVLRLVCKAEADSKGANVIPNEELYLHNLITKVVIALKENLILEGV